MSDMPMNGATAPEPDPLQAALAAGGQGPPGEIPADHEPTYPGSGLEPVSVDEVEQELLRAIRQAGRVAAGASNAGEIAQAGAGAFAFVQALDKLNAPDPQPPVPQPAVVMPHAVGLVRQALAADHGIPHDTFDQLLLGAHHHLNDLQQGGTPEAPPPGAPEPQQGAPSGQ